MTNSSALLDCRPARVWPDGQGFSIAGFQKCSLVDFPGKLAAAVFTPGCNMDCFYCHNRGILAENGVERLNADAVLAALEKRAGFLNGVVISGGEPTLQPGLENFIREVRAMGYAVKLDTNGSNPERLSALIQEGLLDYVAMDLKAPARRYEEICGRGVDLDDIKSSVEILLLDRVDYEFRTTVAPQLGLNDLLAMGNWVRGARRYYLQQYRPQNHHDPRCAVAPHAPETLELFAHELRRILPRCEVRGTGTGASAQTQTSRADAPLPARILAVPALP